MNYYFKHTLFVNINTMKKLSKIILFIGLFPITIVSANNIDLIENEIGKIEFISNNESSLNRGGTIKSVTKTPNVSRTQSYAIVKDLTGNAPSKIFERFDVDNKTCSTKLWPDGSSTDCNTGRSRMEISIDPVAKHGQERWYSYWIYFTNQFETNNLVQPYLGQFKCKDKKGGTGTSPIYSLNALDYKYKTFGVILIEPENFSNQWHKIEMNIKWSTKNDGFIKLYANNELKKEILNYPTLPKQSKCSFRYGIYQNKDNQSPYATNFKWPRQIVYFAEFKRTKKRED